MGFQNTVTSLGGIIVQSVINGFGVLFLAGYTAASKLYGLLEIAASSYGYAMSSYVGQNMGAARIDRIKKGLRSANSVGIITALLMSAIMLLFGKNILVCFITGHAEHVKAAVDIGYQFLTLLALFFPLLYVLYIIRGCIQGMGNALVPLASSIVQLLMRTGCESERGIKTGGEVKSSFPENYTAAAYPLPEDFQEIQHGVEFIFLFEGRHFLTASN